MSDMRPDNARQGKKGTPVLLVLIAALVLCVLLFLAFGGTGWFDRTSDLSNAENAGEVNAPANAGANSSNDTVAPAQDNP